jgi:hypothetical protein
MSDQDNGQVITLQRPTTDDPDAWKTMVAHVVKTENLAKLRATFLLFGYYWFYNCPADPS